MSPRPDQAFAVSFRTVTARGSKWRVIEDRPPARCVAGQSVEADPEPGERQGGPGVGGRGEQSPRVRGVTGLGTQGSTNAGRSRGGVPAGVRTQARTGETVSGGGPSHLSRTVFMITGTGVHDRPESVFRIHQNQRSRSTGTRNLVVVPASSGSNIMKSSAHVTMAELAKAMGEDEIGDLLGDLLGQTLAEEKARSARAHKPGLRFLRIGGRRLLNERCRILGGERKEAHSHVDRGDVVGPGTSLRRATFPWSFRWNGRQSRATDRLGG